MSRRIFIPVALSLAALAVTPSALGAIATGDWKGSSIGTDHRLGSITFRVDSNDVVRRVYLRNLKIRCETQNGNFSYRAPVLFRGTDQLGANNGFYFSQPAEGNGTQKVRGHLIDLGARFRGLVRVHGDFIADGEDLGDCDSGFIPWRAREA